MKYKNILFDLDGTLSDPKIGITKSVQYALKKLNIIEDNLGNLEKFIGPPLQKSFMEIYSFDEKRAWEAVCYYREYFKERGMYENEVYPGINNVLFQLKKEEKTLIVATSKPTIFARQILDHFGLSNYFSFIHGSEMDGTRSDKTDLISFVIRKYNLDQKQTVMIGDRKHDIIGAKNCDIGSIAVLYGYGSEEELMSVAPTYLIKDITDILKVVS